MFKSFAQGGSVYSVIIYTSEFGQKRLADEEKYGPEGRIVEENRGFDDIEEEEEEEDHVNEARRISANFTSICLWWIGLRKYERERRRYYFAVIECDNKFTANSIYELTDGTEFMVSNKLILNGLSVNQHIHPSWQLMSGHS